MSRNRKVNRKMSETETPPPVENQPDLPGVLPAEPPPVATTLPEIEGLRLGAETKGVFDLQIRIGSPGTGVYDVDTEQAVRQLQASWGMPVTGIADEHVHARLGLMWPEI